MGSRDWEGVVSGKNSAVLFFLGLTALVALLVSLPGPVSGAAHGSGSAETSSGETGNNGREVAALFRALADAQAGGNRVRGMALARQVAALSPEDMALDDAGYRAVVEDMAAYLEAIEDLEGAALAWTGLITWAEDRFGAEEFVLVHPLESLARIEIRRAREAAALGHLERSVAIARTHLAADDAVLRWHLIPLADLYDRMGETAKAAALRGEIESLESRGEKINILTGEIAGRDRDGAGDAAESAMGRDGVDLNYEGFRIVPVYYATHRVPREGRSVRPTEYFTERHTDNLQYGRALVSVPNHRRIGASSLVAGFIWWDREQNFLLLRDVESAQGRDAFLDTLRAMVGETTCQETVVFIHGFDVDFERAAKQTAQIAYDLELQGPAVFYDWPSPKSIAGYPKVRSLKSPARIRKLVQFLRDIRDRTGTQRVSVVAYSTGSQFLLDALERMLADGSSEPPFHEILIAAPDSEAASFGEKAAKVSSLARRMTVYLNGNDRTTNWLRDQFGLEGIAGDLDNLDALLREVRRGGGAGRIDVVETTDAPRQVVHFEDGSVRETFGDVDFIGGFLADFMAVTWLGLTPEARCMLRPRTRASGRFWSADGGSCTSEVFAKALTEVRKSGLAGALRSIELAIEDLEVPPMSAQDDRKVEALTKVKQVVRTMDGGAVGGGEVCPARAGLR